MKASKNLLILCAAVALLATLLVGCGDRDPKPELKFELNADGESYSVVGIVYEDADGVFYLDHSSYSISTGADKEVVIPAEYKGKPVTGIGDSAFRNQGSLKSITIPDSVTGIGDFAFFGCTGLKSLTIPAGVTSIGDGAFGGCSTYVPLIAYDTNDNGTVQYFFKCEVIDITVAEGNPVYHEEGNCLIETAGKTLIAGFTDSVIPTDGSVTHIGDYAFASCGGLASIMIPGVVINKTYGSTTIPGNATIGGGMSYGWESDGIVSMRRITTDITLPGCIVSIGANAFSDCSDLETVMISDSVTDIGEGAFRGCSMLTDIMVDKNNASYRSSGNCLIETASKTLIAGCKSSMIPSDGSVTVIGESAFQNCLTTGYSNYLLYPETNTIVIPDSVTIIEKDAFRDCTTLGSIRIGNGVTVIGEGVFHGCSGLANIAVGKNNTNYHSSGNCLIETASKTLIAGCKNSVIPSDGSVTAIGESAFYDRIALNYYNAPLNNEDEYESFIRNSMVSITIPDSVTEIGKDAFARCNALEGITIGNSVTVIGENAFSECDSLTSLTIPDSVTVIDAGAFSATSLTSITFTGTKAQWQAIDKGTGWCEPIYPSLPGSNAFIVEKRIITIHCTDGDITTSVNK